jgi:FMN-dependent NADH-azoreductase
LKGWIDQVIRVGRTVLFNPNGPQGLLTGKKAVVITSRGGSYRAGTPTAQHHNQEPYLRHILAFVGLTDATFIHAETQKTGELGESSRAAAIAQIQGAAVEQTAVAALQ